VELQPQYIGDALYKNNTDATAAARAIDLYKSDKGKRKPTAKNSAAQSVGRTSKASIPSANNITFSESQVAAMSTKDFDKNEEAIMDAMRSGKFNYDVSGGAR
jgi:hypothetical protein